MLPVGTKTSGRPAQRWLSSLVTGLIVVAWSANAWAASGDEPPPPPAAQETSRAERVRVLHDKAFEHYDAKRYAEAAAYFEEAAKIEPSPELLWNAARAHDRAGQRNEAVAWYQQFLNQASEPEQQLATARARVAILTMEMRGPSGFDAPRWPGWVVVAAGTALAVGGALMMSDASSRHDTLTGPIQAMNGRSSHPTHSYREIRRESSNIQETQDAGVALLATGIGLTVGGAAWVLAPRADDERPATPSSDLPAEP